MAKQLFLLSAFSISSVIAGAQSQGPNIPLNVNNTSCPFSYSSTLDFQPTSAVSVSDDSYAIANHCDCCDANSRCLETTNYGFSIPTNATITGIVVEIEKHASSGSSIQDNGLRIIKNGSTTGTDHLSSANWGFTDAWYTYGSSTDLWGTTWTPADINANNFGVAFAAISYTCFGNNKAAVSSIDNIRITVHYTTTTSIVASSSQGALSIAPNPSTGTFNLMISRFDDLSAARHDLMIEVCNVLGETVHHQTIQSPQPGGGQANHQIDLSAQPKGIYFLKARSGNNVVTSKLVLN